MRKILLTITILLVSTLNTIQSQNRDVAFIHGINAEGHETWDNVSSVLSSEYQITPSIESYSSENPISTIATNYAPNIPLNSVAVAHSMGGLVSREIIRTQGTNRISALITTGTPHYGAPIVDNIGNIATLLYWWAGDLAAGPGALLGWRYGNWLGNYYIGLILSPLSSIVTDVYNTTHPPAQDLSPGSSFLNTINNNFNNTVPDAHYVIYGSEDWNSPWRLGDSFAENGEESGYGIGVNNYLTSVYWYIGFLCGWIADDYLYLFLNSGNPDYYYEYAYWSNVSQGFFWGNYSLSYLEQLEWDLYLVGAITENSAGDGYLWWVDDGIVPVWSQIPILDIDVLRIKRANHANHVEEHSTKPEAMNAFRYTFERDDIGINLRP